MPSGPRQIAGPNDTVAVVRQSNLPATAKCPIDIDQAQGDVSLGDRELVLHLQLGAFQRKQAIHIGLDIGEELFANSCRRLRRDGTPAKMLSLLLRPQEGAERRLSFLSRYQDLALDTPLPTLASCASCRRTLFSRRP